MELVTETVTKKHILVESNVVIEPGLPWGFNRDTPKDQESWLKQWASELQDFFRDHRSIDVHSVSVESRYETVCSGCHNGWEEMTDDDTGAVCCAWCGKPLEVVR